MQDNDRDRASFKDVAESLREWTFYLTSKWKEIIISAIIGGVIGFAYAYSKNTLYKAELTFALEDEQSGGGLGGALGLASQFGIDVGGSGGGAFSGDNLIELMKSRSMIEKTLLTSVEVDNDEKTLAELYIDFNNLRERWNDTPELRSIQFLPSADRLKFTRLQDSILGVFYRSVLKSSLAVSKIDKQLSILKISVNTENEFFSKAFAEVLAKEVSDFYIETKIKKSTENLSILQHQTDSVRKMLNNALAGVAASADVNPNPNLGRQILRVPSQRRQIDVQANQAILTELVKNLEISKISLRKETPLIQIIDKPILPLEKMQPSKILFLVQGAVLSAFIIIVALIVNKLIKS